MTRQDIQLKVRLPQPLQEWLKEVAKRNHRSQNAELVYRLEESKRMDEGAIDEKSCS